MKRDEPDQQLSPIKSAPSSAQDKACSGFVRPQILILILVVPLVFISFWIGFFALKRYNAQLF
jgi:hypothetical protein